MNTHAACTQGQPCTVWAARIHTEDPAATATPWTRQLRAEMASPWRKRPHHPSCPRRHNAAADCLCGQR